MNMKWSVVRTLLLPFLMTLVFAQHAFAASTREIDWHERDAYAGWVTDAATGEPIEGAVVVAVWKIERAPAGFMPPTEPREKILRLEETLTDQNGYFSFAPLGDYSPPAGWDRNSISFPLIRFFKPGYSPEAHTASTWEHGQQYLREAESTPRKEEGWSREVRLYKYSTRPKRTLVYDPSSTQTEEQEIVEQLNGFAGFIDRNVRAASQNGEARKAIAAQERAIFMLNEEINKYRANFQWANSSELREALRKGAKKDSR